jgi:uncharacterized protein
MDLRGASVLLTGATGGIGHAIARRLHAEGASLILTGRRKDVLDPLAAELGATALAVDLAEPGAAQELAEAHRDVDVLVANAALPASGALSSFSLEQIDRALEVNLRGPIVMTRVLLDAWASRGRGHAVLISSLSGMTGAPGTSIYSATKFGLRGFSQGLRGDLHGTGVSSSVVFPGFVREAGMFAAADVKLPKGVGTSSPDEVAAAVVRCVRDDAAEVVVAPRAMRAMTTFAALAPELSARLARLAGSNKISGDLAAGHAADAARYR